MKTLATTGDEYGFVGDALQGDLIQLLNMGCERLPRRLQFIIL
jgi:hypothetical protein